MPELPPIDTFDRLTENIQDELVAMNVPLNLQLDRATLGNLAEAIAINITYAFDVRWAPNWVKAGQPHRWQEGNADGTTYLVRGQRRRRLRIPLDMAMGPPDHRRVHPDRGDPAPG